MSFINRIGTVTIITLTTLGRRDNNRNAETRRRRFNRITGSDIRLAIIDAAEPIEIRLIRLLYGDIYNVRASNLTNLQRV